MFYKIIPFIIVSILLFSLPVFANDSCELLIINNTTASISPNIEIQSNESVNLFINNKSHNSVVFVIPELNLQEQIEPNSSKLISLKLNYPNDKTLLYGLYENGVKHQYATLLVKTSNQPEVISSTRNITLYDQEITTNSTQGTNYTISEADLKRLIEWKQEQSNKIGLTTQSERYIRAYW